jgi:hypothetical protein
MKLKAILLCLALLPSGFVAGEDIFSFGGPIWMFKPTVPFAAVHGELHFPSPEEDCNLLFCIFQDGWNKRSFTALPGGIKNDHLDGLRFSLYLQPPKGTPADSSRAPSRYSCRLVLQFPRGYGATYNQEYLLGGDEFDSTTNYHTGRFVGQNFQDGIVPLFYIASRTAGKGPILEPRSPTEILEWHSNSAVIVCYLVRDQTTLEWLAPTPQSLLRR